ncbi:hypothetical protein [Chelativorans sp. M5D2P16]|uniref:hypothetical protein n=1 Tax=Chelativorans sp. M5D2P16 TaxID=3095678 RepID=UPI002ACA26BA|nr:hypothetical protein [Chelativorans sp. M5D2P16]MDZ5700121.1 hypothetical protein [Chelativorans sp. M5D2P16]
MQKVPFAERAEMVLIFTMLGGIALVAQRWSIDVYRFGLVVLVAATFLQIAVGNVPKHLGFAGTAVRTLIILAVIVALFCLGIFLVPFLAQLGR